MKTNRRGPQGLAGGCVLAGWLSSLVDWISSLGDFLETHRDGVTAVAAAVSAAATFFIALFTYTLKRSTDKLWTATRQTAEAAQKSADAAIAAERPRVFLSKITFDRFGGDILKRDSVPVVNTGFKNIGRTVAIVSGLRIKMDVIENLPETPDYGPARIFFPAGLSIAPGEEWFPQMQMYAEFDPAKHTHPDPSHPLPFRSTFWVYGYIAYLDHLDQERRHGFVAWYSPPGVHGPLGDTSGRNFIRCKVQNYSYDT